MTNAVLPQAVSSKAVQLRDGDKSASVPDFFHQCEFDLYALGSLYRACGDQFNRALLACRGNRTDVLQDAVVHMRINAARIAELAKELERKLGGYRADDIDGRKGISAHAPR